VIGDAYQFYEKPFLNLHVAYWHATAAAIIAVPLLIISLFIVCCAKCPAKCTCKENQTVPLVSDSDSERESQNISDKDRKKTPSSKPSRPKDDDIFEDGTML